MAGRPRKSDALKKAQGTFQPCRSFEKLATSTAQELTEEAPQGLPPDAAEAWAVAVRHAPRGLLVATDFSVLERWSRNYALYRQLARAVDEEGVTQDVLRADGNARVVVNPNLTSLIGIQKVLAACERELGFTPASRVRVRMAVTEDGEEKEEDGFGSFV
ncbi:phage terminase small subunit P27 family [Sutterella sp.]|uniref:phage terminase small subunit P27 family n=1 Tax=Sutterella sp. TaxID=1981025 RepID=UPI0026DFFF88|nr:phage terminase small subunit P27 family [Sutterella sp.]MDO5531414.1 phage terminase small subunit P27 family [Sutterella sp.]